MGRFPKRVFVFSTQEDAFYIYEIYNVTMLLSKALRPLSSWKLEEVSPLHQAQRLSAQSCVSTGDTSVLRSTLCKL